MRSLLARTGIIAVAVAALGLLVAATGIIPIKASSGHLPPVRWFLDFAKGRSISTHAMTVRVPPLDDPALVLRGAGHYESGCRPCHGAPGSEASEVAGRMLPGPTLLPQGLREWEAAELFYIVKHGLKLTGMPAWPSQQRDDEVWAMVAFLRILSGLGERRYGELARGDRAGGEGPSEMEDLSGASREALSGCVRCHAMDGLGSPTGAFPKIGGQRIEYLEASLAAYADGSRHSGTMGPLSAGLERATTRELARYFAGRSFPTHSSDRSMESSSATGDPARGEVLARLGNPSRRIPSCIDCHGPGTAPRNARYPILAGQYESYLLLQLRLFKQGRRGGSTYAPIMQHVVSNLEEQEMRDVAAWYASLSWSGD